MASAETTESTNKPNETELNVESTSTSEVSEISMKEIVEDELKNLSKRAKRRIERIQLQKEKKKAKKAEKREEREKLMKINPRLVCPRARGPDPDPVIAEQNRERNRAAKDKVRQSILDDAKQGPIVVFDMSVEWELAMTVAERASLAQQLMYCYGSNKRCIKPARLLTTGLPENGVVDRALHKHAGKNSWLSFDFSNKPLNEHLDVMRQYGVSLEHFDKISKNKPVASNQTPEIQMSNNKKENENNLVEKSEKPNESTFKNQDISAAKAEDDEDIVKEEEEVKEVVTKNDKEEVEELKLLESGVDMYYLTADTENVLDEVPWNNHTIYVIGAIVDRNRLTRAAVIKAEKLGIKPVALPLEKYCDLSSTKVLTVNHTLEILQRRGCGESWDAAFANTLPTRKDITIKTKSIEKIKHDDEDDEKDQQEEAGGGGGDTVENVEGDEEGNTNKKKQKIEQEPVVDHSFSRDVRNL